jgi:hypothetical protein
MGGESHAIARAFSFNYPLSGHARTSFGRELASLLSGFSLSPKIRFPASFSFVYCCFTILTRIPAHIGLSLFGTVPLRMINQSFPGVDRGSSAADAHFRERRSADIVAQ